MRRASSGHKSAAPLLRRSADHTLGVEFVKEHVEAAGITDFRGVHVYLDAFITDSAWRV
jgi:hypothetical protein